MFLLLFLLTWWHLDMLNVKTLQLSLVNFYRWETRVQLTALTFTVTPRWMVEREAQWDDGCNFQDNERDVLQSLPHQLQKCLGLLGGDEVLSKRCVTFLEIDGVTRQTCKHKRVHFHIVKLRADNSTALAGIKVACEHETWHKWVSTSDHWLH